MTYLIMKLKKPPSFIG